MRFKRSGQEATQSLWSRWKGSIKEILDDFNSDVFGGKGHVRENKFRGKPCLLLATKKECLYVFPSSGYVLAFCLYNCQTQDNAPNPRALIPTPDEENLVFWTGLDIKNIEIPYRASKTDQQRYVTQVLKRVYRMHWMRLLT